MAVAFESDGAVIWAAANNNNAVSVTLPATRPTGSVLLFAAWCRLITAAAPAPSGYTSLGTWTSGTASGGRMWLYAKEVVGGETAPSVTPAGATGTSGDIWGASIYCYSGVDLSGGIGAILDGTPTVTDASGTTTCTYPALTITNADSMLIRFLCRFRDAADTFTPTATWTEQEDASTTNRTGGQHHWQDKLATASGAQASVTVAPSNTTAARYLAVTAALKAIPPPAVLSQAQYRFRNDDGNETTATWKAAVNTVGGTIDADTRFRLRVTVDETSASGNPAAATYKLQTRIGSGTWFDVNSSGTICRPSASPNLADDAATTQQLSSGLGTFVAGSFDEVDGAAASVDLAAGGVSELEWSLLLYGNGEVIAPGDTINFRVVTTAGGLLNTYAVTPSLTVGAVPRTARVTWAMFEVPAVGVTAVGAQVGLPYAMTGAVGSQRATPYKVIAGVGSQRAVPYKLLNEVGAQRAVPYKVFKEVGGQRALPYALIAAIGSQRALPFKLIAEVGGARALPYLVRAEIGGQRALPFKLNAAVGGQRALPYGIAGVAGAQRALVYAVLNTVGAQRALLANVLTVIGSQRALPYGIRAEVGGGRALPYAVTVPAGSQRALPFAVVASAAAVGAARAFPYGIAGIAGAERAFPYALLTPVGSQRALPARVLVLIGAARALLYAVTVLVGSQRSVPYAVFAAAGSARSLPFKLIAEVGASRSLPYAIIVPPQRLRPAADLATGTWTVTPLYPKLDEILIPDDGDYITSATNPAADTALLSLTGGGDPSLSTGHVLRFRTRKDSPGGDAATLTVRIKQGATVIKEVVQVVPDAFTTYEATLSGAEADAITDYSTLTLELVAD